MKTVENGTAPGYQSVINYLHYQQIPTGFTGDVLYFTLGRQYINGYAWTNGSISKAISLGAATTPSTQINKTGKLKTDALELVNCQDDDYDVYLITNGNEDTEQYLYTITVTTCDIVDTGGGGSSEGGVSGGGGSGVPAQNPCTPASNPAKSVEYFKGRRVIDVAAPVGGTTNPPTASQPCPTTNPPPTTTTTTTTTVDPCAQKAVINSKAANATISNENKQLLAAATSSKIEEGFAQNLQSLTGSTYDVTSELSATAADPDEIKTTFSWNSTNGYTIGFTHDHPNGTGPSPEDIFSMLINSKSPTLTSAGASAVSFYKSNSSVTVVTNTNNYVVTISDWSKLQTLYTQYLVNPTAFDKKVIDNSNGSNYEAAILSAFGSAINLYTDNGTPGDYTPLTVNSANAVSEVPCPTK